MKALACVLSATLLGSLPAQGQPLVLTLEAAQARALRDNRDLQLFASQIDEARALKLQVKSAHLPQVQFSDQALRSDDAVTTFGLRLRQERFTQADFALETLNQPEALTDYQTSLEVRQSLFAGGANLARQYAQERLRLADLHYAQGLIATPELLDAEDQHTQARLRYLEALRQLRAGLAYLEYAASQPNPGVIP